MPICFSLCTVELLIAWRRQPASRLLVRVALMVSASRALDVIHHGTEDGRPYRFQAAYTPADGAFAGVLGVEYEQDTVALGGYDSRVRNQLRRWRVQQHVIEVLAYLLQKIRKPLGAKELGRVERQGADGNHFESLHRLLRNLFQAVFADQHVHDAVDVAYSESLVQNRPAKITVHDQRVLIRLGQCDSQVGAECTFAFTRVRARDRDNFRGLVHERVEEVGAQSAESLRGSAVGLRDRYQTPGEVFSVGFFLRPAV